MIIKKTEDIEEIRSILCHPEIYLCIAGDSSPPANEFVIPLQGITYYGCYVEGEIIGLVLYHVDNERLFGHFQVLPKYREKYAAKFAIKTLNEQLKKHGSVYAEIPVCYPNVLRFVLGFGFKEIESSDKPYIKDGEPYEIKILRCDYGVC